MDHDGLDRPNPGIGRIDLDAVGHRVGDVLFRDHADHVRRPPLAKATHDQCHHRVLPPKALYDVEDDVVLTHYNEVAACQVPQRNGGLGPFDACLKAVLTRNTPQMRSLPSR